MAQRRRPSRRRRRGRFGLLYRVFAVLAVLAAVIVACVVFFRVNEVLVNGNSRYTAQEIVDASGVKTGDNLLALSKGRVAGTIRAKLPYVESVSIAIKLPDCVVITVGERVAAASVESAEGRWLMSAHGRILEPAGAQDVVEIVGLEVVTPYPGGLAVAEEKDALTLEHVTALLQALEEKEMLKQSRRIDCTAVSYLTLEWGIYTVKLPRGGDYPYMLRLLQGALNSEKLPADQPGIFDLTVEEGVVHFKPVH
ncbi:MAG: FtsQ-type POTRA domain-containing protein [Oscillospiraceae bacterium]|nr:FtsQ-type POTRA domain-containing protein [Oscillospiraceae bacterium]